MSTHVISVQTPSTKVLDSVMFYDEKLSDGTITGKRMMRLTYYVKSEKTQWQPVEIPVFLYFDDFKKAVKLDNYEEKFLKENLKGKKLGFKTEVSLILD